MFLLLFILSYFLEIDDSEVYSVRITKAPLKFLSSGLVD